nr:Uncharacterised protein [Salmonella sp. NCTC 7297]
MESAWLSRNQRRLELTKTVSLKTLLGDSGFANLITAGVVNFSLDEKLFDNDYPGHYLRQIKFVTLSLPTLLGPWQDVRATLTQTSSSTLLKADIDGVNYLNNTHHRQCRERGHEPTRQPADCRLFRHERQRTVRTEFWRRTLPAI